MAERGPVDAAGGTAADVARHQLDRPADGRVGPVAVAEDVDPRVHADGDGDGPVDHEDRSDRHRGGEHAVHVELVGADRLDRCQDDRQVLGAAAGQHGVDGHLLDRAPDEVRWNECHDLVRGSGGALEHSGHACLGGWDDREAVGPPAVEQCLVVILELGQFDAAGGEPGGAEPCPEFVDPTEQQKEATVLMLGRAIEVILSLNGDRNFFYRDTYTSDRLARDIVDYVIARRTSIGQNRIYHTTELLNIPSITREIFYGPGPEELPEEGLETDAGFLLQKDEFGDLSATYIYDSDQEFLREQEADALSGLMDAFPGGLPPELIKAHGQEFPGIGGLNANSLTRGMTGPAQAFDEEGYEYIEQPEVPIGLQDLFTTFSSGKININTASMPVLYALLPSLREGDDEEAENVALLINDYRFEYQEFEEEEAVAGVERADQAMLKDLGQPKRPLPPEEEEFGEELDLNSMVGVDQMGLDGTGSTPMADVETNYFTNIEQIELVDGTAGDADDLLTSEVGVDRVDADDDPLLQRVLNDYRDVMCFAGTYFTIELKAKTQTSPLVKSGIMIIKRNVQEKLMEVVLWKELQD